LDFQPDCMREACHIHLGKAMDTISVPGCSTVVSGHLAIEESEGDIMTYSAVATILMGEGTIAGH
jgi:hypothetical protein